MSEPLEHRLRARLDRLRDQQLIRTLRAPSGVDLSSNDYLGLADHALLKQAFVAGVKRDGCGSTGSRLLRGERESFAALERRFAAFKGADRALYFSSGYLANLAVLATFPEAGDIILSDERNHASLIDGIRLSRATRAIFPHNDATALARLLQDVHRAGQTFVVTESLFSMDGDVPPLTEYAALCRSAGALLVVDEAHAVGMYGARGSGLLEALGISDDVFVSINPAGKALGVAGAFVAGPAWAIEYLIQRGRPLMFSTAPPPALAAALDASLDIVASEPERRARLADRVRVVRARLSEAGISLPAGTGQIIPIVLGSNERALASAEALQLQGFDVRAVRPPSVPPGTARLRLSVNVNLSDEVIDRFVRALALATSAASTTV